MSRIPPGGSARGCAATKRSGIVAQPCPPLAMRKGRLLRSQPLPAGDGEADRINERNARLLVQIADHGGVVIRDVGGLTGFTV